MNPTTELSQLLNRTTTTFFKQFRSWFGLFVWFLPFLFLNSYFARGEPPYSFVGWLSIALYIVASIILSVSLLHRWAGVYREYLNPSLRKTDSLVLSLRKFWVVFFTGLLELAIIVALFVIPLYTLWYGITESIMSIELLGIVLVLVASIFVLILTIYWMFTTHQIVFKNQSYWKALKASKILVTKNWWRTLLYLWVLVILLLIVLTLVQVCIGLVFVYGLKIPFFDTWWGEFIYSALSLYFGMFVSVFNMHYFFGLLTKKGAHVKPIIVDVEPVVETTQKVSSKESSTRMKTPKKNTVSKKSVAKKTVVKKTTTKKSAKKK